MNLEQEFARDLVELLELPDSEAATALNGRMLAIERVEQLRAKSFAQRGLIAVEFQKRELFKHLNFETFSDWIASGFMGSRSSIYDAKRDIEALQGDVPQNVLVNIADKNPEDLSPMLCRRTTVCGSARDGPGRYARRLRHSPSKSSPRPTHRAANPC